MTPIKYALQNLRHGIPIQILKYVFTTHNRGWTQSKWKNVNRQQSIDSMIRDKVIEGRVNVDCNLKGAMQIAIPLDDIRFDLVDIDTRIYQIGKEHTDGRNIISVQTLNYVSGRAQLNIPDAGATDQLSAAAVNLFRASSAMPVISTASCQLIGDNVVMIKDTINHLAGSHALICLVDNDDEMRNLNAGIFKLYAKLVELATKAYIFNNLDIELDQGALMGGMNIGKIREIVDSYADSNELYLELFDEKWGISSFTNDRIRMNRYISSMMGKR